jgi:hypothetical protein
MFDRNREIFVNLRYFAPPRSYQARKTKPTKETHMKASVLQRLLQGSMAVGMSAVMLAAFTGVSAAAPRGHGDGEGNAASQAAGTRPGWGCGDRNHVHTGPPGGGGSSPCGQRGEGQEEGALHLAVAAPASAVPGTAFTFTVTALQRSDTVTSFADTVHFTSSDASASLPADSTLTNGSGTFTATLRTAGTQTITATDTANSSVSGISGAIAVSVTPAPHLVISVPASATAGSAFSVTVAAMDQNNNVTTGFADTVHFTSTDSSASLPADSTLTNGTGTFSVTLHTAGSQTITATDTANSALTGTSGAVAVSAAAATHTAVSAPGSVMAGGAFNFTVTAQDQFNNTATGYTGTVHFTSSDGAASLPADSTLSSGVGTFSATLHTVGSQTISATDTATSSITGTSGAIAVS